MPHRAPFLCLNWGAVCASMNYSIYLLRRSRGLFRETAANSLVLTCAFARFAQKSDTFPLIVLRICSNPPVFTHSCDVQHGIVPVLPPLLSILFLLASLWDMWYVCYPDRPCLPALVFRQLESLYMSVMPHQNSVEKDEFSPYEAKHPPHVFTEAMPLQNRKNYI